MSVGMASYPAWPPIETNPKDGSPFWGYLFEAGIRKLRWMEAAEVAAEYGEYATHFDGDFVECSNTDNEWEPLYWLPEDAIPEEPSRWEWV